MLDLYVYSRFIYYMKKRLLIPFDCDAKLDINYQFAKFFESLIFLDSYLFEVYSWGNF